MSCSWQRIRLVAVFQLKERTMSYYGTSIQIKYTLLFYNIISFRNKHLSNIFQNQNQEPSQIFYFFFSFPSKIFVSSITNSLFFLVMHAQDSTWPLLVFTQWIFIACKACCIKICIRVKRTNEACCRFLDGRFNSSRTVDRTLLWRDKLSRYCILNDR